jgi:putative hydrolase of the HAD superfamily
MSKQPNWDLIAGIVLDAVGTLIKPVPSVAEAYTEAARRQGVELNRDVVRMRFETSFRSDEVRGSQGVYSTDEATERRRWRRIVGEVLPEVPDPKRAFNELWDHFGRPESWRCFPEVAPALRELHGAGIAVCVGSNFDARLRPVVLGLAELAGAVDNLVISSEVGYRKPHPLFYQAACDRLGLPASRVLCVGDDLETDVRGAVQAGLSALLLDRGDNPPQDLPHVPNLAVLVKSRLENVKFPNTL